MWWLGREYSGYIFAPRYDVVLSGATRRKGRPSQNERLHYDCHTAPGLKPDSMMESERTGIVRDSGSRLKRIAETLRASSLETNLFLALDTSRRKGRAHWP